LLIFFSNSFENKVRL